MAEQRYRLTWDQKKEIANKVLHYLSQRTAPVKTGSIVASIDLTFKTPEYNIRRTLDKLAEAGAVRRIQDQFSSSRHRWEIVSKNWNHDNPFKYSHAQMTDDDDSEEELERRAKTIEPARQSFDNYDAKAADAQLTKRLNELNLSIAGLVAGHKLVHEFMTEQKKTIEALKKELEDRPIPKIIEIRRYDAKPIKIEDEILPKEFNKIMDLANCRRNILLVGPTGCGKSYVARKVAQYLGDFEFSAISFTAGMSEAHLLGRAIPDLTHGKNRFQTTEFLRRYEYGGVMLLDEFDAADSNLALCLNTGLSNDYISVPNRPDEPIAKKHKDCIIIATANTYGRGATRMFAGRNQLDESSLERFRMGLVEMDYDKPVETQLCPNVNLRNWCWSVRQKIEASGIRRVMSTRFMQDAQIMTTYGWGLEEVKQTYFSGWTEEEKRKVS